MKHLSNLIYLITTFRYWNTPAITSREMKSLRLLRSPAIFILALPTTELSLRRITAALFSISRLVRLHTLTYTLVRFHSSVKHAASVISAQQLLSCLSPIRAFPLALHVRRFIPFFLWSPLSLPRSQKSLHGTRTRVGCPHIISLAQRFLVFACRGKLVLHGKHMESTIGKVTRETYPCATVAKSVASTCELRPHDDFHFPCRTLSNRIAALL
jgi:hypothetical protein